MASEAFVPLLTDRQLLGPAVAAAPAVDHEKQGNLLQATVLGSRNLVLVGGPHANAAAAATTTSTAAMDTPAGPGPGPMLLHEGILFSPTTPRDATPNGPRVSPVLVPPPSSSSSS